MFKTIVCIVGYGIVYNVALNSPGYFVPRGFTSSAVEWTEIYVLS